MGRALLSARYGSQATAAAATAPQPAIVDPEPVQYDKWSFSNRFDPESDEFWANAQFEAFVDRAQVVDENPNLVAVAVTEDPNASDGSSSSESSGSDSGRDTPEAVDGRVNSPLWTMGVNDQLLAQIQQLTHIEDSGNVAIRAVPEEPVPVPILSNNNPVTPPRQAIALPNSVTPSPLPTVTPRIYVWNRTQPSSPSVRYTTSGPLTNPTARQSFAHITPRRLIQNA